MDIYTSSADRKVTLRMPVTPVGNSIEVGVYKDDLEVYNPNTVDFVDGVFSFTLPLAFTQSDNTYEVKWQFVYNEDGQTFEHNETTELNIVTPILPLYEVKKVLGDDFDDDQAADVERAVRYIIQAHTGQFFGKYIGKKSVSGSGEPYLRLPMRLLSLNGINGNTYLNESLALRGSGWYLQSRTYGVPTIRADAYGWHEDPWGYSGRVPIVAPYTKAVFNFIKHAEYEIDGVWGWKSVPGAVQEAARLLVNDYACADANYRDRFLTSMTAADWRIQFHEGAFSNTGNVRANQLLAEYVLRRGWVVV
jgi:hypothetical protein